MALSRTGHHRPLHRIASLNKKLNGYTVASIRQWWETMGHATDLAATRLLITADGGGSNGSRNHR
ncbi:MAG: hypothetical protein KDJ54_15025 [Candidatus Competibacteraceae bacterium]|nr:hypothetical protein [Candidatus Competibacteraceae bacterium]